MSAPRKVAGYGWLPQLPDIRDARLALPAVTSLPSSVDLSSKPDMPPVYDQGQLGSCTANAIAAAVDFQNHRQDQKWLTPSRLWIYYQERVMEGTVSQDSGAQIRDGMKAVAKLGVCPETDWPYDIATFAAEAAEEGLHGRAEGQGPHVRVRAAGPLRAQERARQRPSGRLRLHRLRVVRGRPRSPRPASCRCRRRAKSIVGGHAVLMVGYDDAHDRFRVRNSWGTSWGQDGYFEMPYQYATSTQARVGLLGRADHQRLLTRRQFGGAVVSLPAAGKRPAAGNDAGVDLLGDALETDFVRISDEFGEQEREYLERTRSFVRDEVLPVIAGYWERAEFPFDAGPPAG